MVRPMSVSEIPKPRASDTAPSTEKLPPITTRTSPATAINAETANEVGGTEAGVRPASASCSARLLS